MFEDIDTSRILLIISFILFIASVIFYVLFDFYSISYVAMIISFSLLFLTDIIGDDKN